MQRIIFIAYSITSTPIILNSKACNLLSKFTLAIKFEENKDNSKYLIWSKWMIAVDRNFLF